MANPAKKAREKAQQLWAGATIHARTKGGVLHQHPTNPNRFMLDTQTGGVWHRGDGDFSQADEVDSDFVAVTDPADQPYQWTTGNTDHKLLLFPSNDTLDTAGLVRWVDRDSGLGVTLSFESLDYENDVGGLEPIADPANISPVMGADTVDYIDAYGTGVNLRIFSDLIRMQKELRFTRDNIPAPTISNPEWLRFAVRFDIDNGVDIFINGTEWGTGQTPDTQAMSDVEFKNAQGETLWVFKMPRVWNSTTGGDATGVQSWYRKQGNSLRVYTQTPYSWIAAQLSTDTLVIDPTIDPQVSSSAWDAHENNSGTTFSSTTYLNVNQNSNSNNAYGAGVGFNVTGIESAETVDVAYISVYVQESARDNPSMAIYCEDVDDSADFSTTADVQSRTTTTANATWVTTGIDTTDFVDSPSIVTPVQEVIDRGGWSAGNDMMVLMNTTARPK